MGTRRGPRIVRLTDGADNCGADPAAVAAAPRIVLLTDGADNCGADPAAVAAAPRERRPELEIP